MTVRTELPNSSNQSVQTISVIVPANPFIRGSLNTVQRCLAALNVVNLMGWWPGTPHSPHRDSKKVRAIQRSLDWKRVAQIGAYLLQREIVDVPESLRNISAVSTRRKQMSPVENGRQTYLNWPNSKEVSIQLSQISFCT